MAAVSRTRPVECLLTNELLSNYIRGRHTGGVKEASVVRIPTRELSGVTRIKKLLSLRLVIVTQISIRFRMNRIL
jgi:hypothetical protein